MSTDSHSRATTHRQANADFAQVSHDDARNLHSAAQARRAAQYAPIVEPDFKAKLLADWQLVKRARFEAAERLAQRNSLSLFTLSMVALYGGLITVFVLIFRDSLTPHARSICDWIAAVASWLTLTFSLTEQIKDYSGQSRALHECAQKVNDLRKHLQATPINTSQHLIPFVKAYDAIISECGPNHKRLDYEIGRLSGARALDGLGPKAHAARLRRLRTQSLVATYGIYVVMCLAPAIAGLLAYCFVPVPLGPTH